MFDRVIPSWEQVKQFKQPLTDGEICLLKFLDDNLKKDDLYKEGDLTKYNGWLIFVQPFLNGSRPDIIIFNSNVGAQIFEVKDWNLENYKFETGRDTINSSEVFCVRDKNGVYCPIKSPIKQVEYYKDKIIGQLIPQIGENVDKNKQSYGLIKTAVYFHKSTTEKVQNLFKKQVRDFSNFPVIGYDALLPDNINNVIPDNSRAISTYWVKDWNKEFVFWLNPPFHTIEQGTFLNLIDEQKKFGEPQSGHYRVRGVAGSGKTQILAYRASKLASQGYRVLILTFNITLWHYIHDMVQRSRFAFSWSNLTTTYFHGFCKDILNEFGEKWPNKNDGGESIFKKIVPDKVKEIISRNDFEKYDAILIDEGQDFYFEWYEMLCHFLTGRDEVVVVCDKKQNIYGRETLWLDKRRGGVEKFGDWIELKKIFRLPEQIAGISKDFSEKFNLNQDIKIGNIEKPNLFNQFQDHVIWWNIDEGSWIDKVDEAYETIKKYATYKHPSDTVVLLPNKHFGSECIKYFESKKKVLVNHVFEEDGEKKYHKKKKAFWMGDSRLKMSTIHSFKGWEVPNVIVVVPSLISRKGYLYDNIFYTAMTRAKENLIVINMDIRYQKFGNDYPKQWK